MRRVLPAALAAAILGVLWWRTGWEDLFAVVRGLHPGWCAMALALFVPQACVAAWRWSRIVGAWQPLALGESLRMVLAASALSAVTPAKLGDVAKGAFLRRDRPGGDIVTGLALAAFEKALDLAALCAWMLAATLLAPPREPLGWLLAAGGAAAVAAFGVLLLRPAARRLAARGPGIAARAAQAIARLHGDPSRLLGILAASVALWCLHLLQFQLAAWAAGAAPPPGLLWSRVPMAILVGLVPVTLAGIGTRDAALVYFLAGAIGPGPALALGLFATLRYLVPALAGLPFLGALRPRTEAT